MEVPTESLDMSSWNSITCYPRRTYYNIIDATLRSSLRSSLRSLTILPDPRAHIVADFLTVASYLAIKQKEIKVHRVLPSGSRVPRIQG